MTHLSCQIAKSLFHKDSEDSQMCVFQMLYDICHIGVIKNVSLYVNSHVQLLSRFIGIYHKENTQPNKRLGSLIRLGFEDLL